MKTVTEAAATIKSAVTRVRTVEDVIAPHQKIVTDLLAVKEQREGLINAAKVKIELLNNQIDALEQAIGQHCTEIAEADRLIENFRELLA